MSKPQPLADDELARKFGVEPGTPEFDAARALSDNRPDRTICELPECLCPHCGQEFTATYADVQWGTEMFCGECERLIYIERIDLPEDDGSDGCSGFCGAPTIYLNTHPQGPDPEGE